MRPCHKTTIKGPSLLIDTNVFSQLQDLIINVSCWCWWLYKSSSHYHYSKCYLPLRSHKNSPFSGNSDCHVTGLMCTYCVPDSLVLVMCTTIRFYTSPASQTFLPLLGSWENREVRYRGTLWVCLISHLLDQQQVSELACVRLLISNTSNAIGVHGVLKGEARWCGFVCCSVLSSIRWGRGLSNSYCYYRGWLA